MCSLISGTVVSLTESGSCMRLAVSGWCIRCHVQPDGRTVIEVIDEAGVLTGLVVGTRLPIVSADAGWRGTTRAAGGARHWWALAIGHVPAGAGRPAVTFTRGWPGRPRARRTTVRPATTGGLWVAAVTGRYTTVRCQLPSLEPARLTAAAQPACRLAPVTTRHAPCDLDPAQDVAAAIGAAPREAFASRGWGEEEWSAAREMRQERLTSHGQGRPPSD
jgi:hypothetical protein